jgi:hypothetical protein
MGVTLRWDDYSGKAQHCLLIAHLDVAGGQHPQKLAIRLQLLQIERSPSERGLNDGNVRVAEVPIS